MSNLTVSELFKSEPAELETRGNLYLWEEASVYFQDVALPSSEEQLTSLLAKAFETLTGHSFNGDEDGPLHVSRYEELHGMSSNLVTRAFWRSRAIPLLLAKFRLIEPKPTR